MTGSGSDGSLVEFAVLVVGTPVTFVLGGRERSVGPWDVKAATAPHQYALSTKAGCE